MQQGRVRMQQGQVRFVASGDRARCRLSLRLTVQLESGLSRSTARLVQPGSGLPRSTAGLAGSYLRATGVRSSRRAS